MANPYPPDLTHTRDISSMFDNDGGTANTMVTRIQKPGVVNSVEFVPSWTMTGVATNNRTFTLYNRRTDGTGTTAIAQLSMTAGASMTKAVAKVIPITAANATIVVGDLLQWESLPNGAGMQDPGGLLIVQQSFGQ